MDLAELTSALEFRLDRELKSSRAGHSRAVAALAAELCLRNGLPPEKGRLAGLGHDLCKEMDFARQESYASAYAAYSGRSFVSDGIIGQAALHGPAAAGLLLLEYACHDGEILEALALHTLGGPEMGDLARLVYAADKLEPGRGHVDGQFREACLLLPPRDLFAAVLTSTVEYLLAEGLPVAEESLALYDRSLARGIEA